MAEMVNLQRPQKTTRRHTWSIKACLVKTKGRTGVTEWLWSAELTCECGYKTTSDRHPSAHTALRSVEQNALWSGAHNELQGDAR